MPNEPRSKIRRGDFNVIVRKNNDVAGCLGEAAIVSLAQRAGIVDLDDLKMPSTEQCLIMLANTLGLLRVDAADHGGDGAVVRSRRSRGCVSSGAGRSAKARAAPTSCLYALGIVGGAPDRLPQNRNGLVQSL